MRALISNGVQTIGFQNIYREPSDRQQDKTAKRWWDTYIFDTELKDRLLEIFLTKNEEEVVNNNCFILIGP